MTSSSSSRNQKLQSVQEHYAHFIRGDNNNSNSTHRIPGNANGLEGLGYDAEFMIQCGLRPPTAAAAAAKNQPEPDKSNNQKDENASSSTTAVVDDSLLSSILEPSCGSGCPLRLLRWFHNNNNEPTSTTLLAPGSTVVDLGCGTGHDVLLAAALLMMPDSNETTEPSVASPVGRVIGMDATEEMLVVAQDRGTQFLQTLQYRAAPPPQLEWIHEAVDASIPELELAGQLSAVMADVVMSNGVFNLTRDKEAAFAVAYWLLKPGGRLLLSDVCRVEERPEPGAFFSPFNSDCAVTVGGGDSSWGA